MFEQLRLRGRQSTRLFGAPLALLLSGGSAPAFAHNVNLSYDPSVPLTHRPVIDQAAKYWELRVTSPGATQVNVFVAPLSSGQLGLASGYKSSTGGTDSNGRLTGIPTVADISFDSSAPFFVDSTPADDLEYQPAGPPATYLTAASGPASQAYDLLSVAVHEIGHALGFSSAFSNFAAQLMPGVSYVDYAFASSPLLGDPVADYLAPNAFLNGAALMLLASEEDSEEGGSLGGLPSHLTDVPPGDGTGGLFPMDAMNPTLNTGERIHIADVDLDILADAYGYTVVPEPRAWLQSLAALVGLVSLARGRKSSFRTRAARCGAALVCAGALAACGGGGDTKAECKPLIERRCKGSAMRRQCLSTHSAGCNMVGPAAFRAKLESWEKSQSRR